MADKIKKFFNYCKIGHLQFVNPARRKDCAIHEAGHLLAGYFSNEFKDFKEAAVRSWHGFQFTGALKPENSLFERWDPGEGGYVAYDDINFPSDPTADYIQKFIFLMCGGTAAQQVAAGAISKKMETDFTSDSDLAHSKMMPLFNILEPGARLKKFELFCKKALEAGKIQALCTILENRELLAELAEQLYRKGTLQQAEIYKIIEDHLQNYEKPPGFTGFADLQDDEIENALENLGPC